ncbi:MAG TPA: nucleoside:proton symporter [Actinobacteria bacterium]|jgi:CNT family concentrative nucleoside transporter|nr:nucleoside:proton symporter [Actinomycetota bacterium]
MQLGILGFIAIPAFAWLLSEKRQAVSWRTVVSGVLLQLALAVTFLKFPPAISLIQFGNRAANAIQAATEAGTGFVFGYLGGGPLPFSAINPGASFVLAFNALPIVLVISALASLLFYWGIMQRVAGMFGWLIRRWMGISGPLALGAAVHVFVGMVEAPLLLRPYLARMSRGEIFALMSCGMAGVAGTVMIIYSQLLDALIPNALGNILVASVISTPAALSLAALMVPSGSSTQASQTGLTMESAPRSAVDALVKGTTAGIPVLTGIVATLVVSIAIVALINHALALLPMVSNSPITLQRIFSYMFMPVLWLMGIPGQELHAAAHLMATKTVLNEFVAYQTFATLPADTFGTRSRMILSYALCGFANFGSAGIMIGSMSVILPERAAEVARLGVLSIVSGTMATCMSGALIGVLLG